MPFNGSGVFTLAEPAFVADTPISSAAVNSDLSDIADGLSLCLTNDGQSMMTGQIKAFAGTLAAPGYAWATDLDTGRYRSSANAMADVCGGIAIVQYTTTLVTFPLAVTVVGTLTVPDESFTYAKIQDVSATDKVLGRSSSGAGVIEEITCTAAGRALIDDADAAAQRATLGLGTASVKDTGTSGDAVGLLNGNNTYSGNNTFSGTNTHSGAETFSNTAGITAPNTIKAAALFTVSGTTVNFTAASYFNVASVNRIGAGQYSFLYTGQIPSANAVIVWNALHTSGVPLLVQVTSRDTAGVVFQTRSPTTGLVIECSSCEFMVFCI